MLLFSLGFSPLNRLRLQSVAVGTSCSRISTARRFTRFRLSLINARAPVFLAGDLGLTPRAIAGLVVFATVGAAAGTHMLMRRRKINTQISIGMTPMIRGLVSIVSGVFGFSALRN